MVTLAAKGQLEELDRLIKSGESVNVEDESGTPLSAAAERGQSACADLLITAGADVNRRDFFGDTALFYASYSDNAKGADLLISAGAVVNVQGYNGATPLLQAVYNRSVNFARSLLKAGADPNITNHAGFNALCASLAWSAEGSDEALVTLLHAAGGKLDGFDYEQQLDEILSQRKMTLKGDCRKYINRYLMTKYPNMNLFALVPRLMLPTPLMRYLLYNASLEEDGPTN